MICPNCGTSNEEDQTTCTNCGQDLTAVHAETPAVANADVTETTDLGPQGSIVPETEPDAETGAETGKKTAPWILTGGIVVVIAALALLLNFVILPAFQPSASATRPYLFAAINDTPALGFKAIYRLNPDLKGKTQIAKEKGITVLPVNLLGLGTGLFSPAGSQYTMLTYGQSQLFQGPAEIFLAPVDGGPAIKVGDNAIPYGMFSGYTSDNKYIAVTVADQTTQKIAVKVFDMTGKEISNTVDAAFIGFLPTNKEYMAYKVLAQGVGAVMKVNVADGKPTDIYQAEADKSMEIFSYLTPDGKYLYFHSFTSAVKALYRISTDGGAVELIYKFSQQDSTSPGVSYIAPNGKNLIILNNVKNDTAAQMNFFLTDLKGQNPVTIAENTFDPTLLFGAGLNRSYLNENGIAFSADGKSIAYMAVNGDKLELYTNTLDGKNPVKIADDAKAYSYEFTADSRSLVYLKFALTTDSSGELNVSGVDGKSNVKIDSSVTSLRVVSDSSSLVYFKWDTDKKQSTLLSAGLNGKNQQTLLGPENEMYMFVR